VSFAAAALFRLGQRASGSAAAAQPGIQADCLRQPLNSTLGIMNDFTVVRLSKNDVSIASELGTRVLGEPAVAEARLVELLDDERNIVLAALHEGAAVAYLIAYCFPSLSGEKLVYLYDIEILDAFRRRGIGGQMVSALKDICRSKGVNSIWVGSSQTNVAACALWSSTGAERGSDRFVEFIYEL
jgi:ribosomal protein S18 acetylase RimI-like enzyme